MALNSISAGQLHRQVTIMEATTAKEASGQRVRTYAPTTTLSPSVRYARIRYISGNESTKSDSLVQDDVYEVTMRYAAGLTPAYRFTTDDGDTLEITAVNHDERRSATVCQCRRTT